LAEEKRIEIEQDGQVLSQATITPGEQHNEARAQVHVSSGQLPPGTRRQMADAIHDAVTQDNAEHLTACVPRGEAELVEGICDHLTEVQLRSAGSTSIIQGDVKPA
jgi:hypothetical protein